MSDESRRRSARRIVSLVPSLTESLFALGLGERVAGVTEWCVHPAEGVAALPKLGGTKDPDLAGIFALAPDLVIANHEENTERAVRKLRESGLDVWVTYPRSVRDGADLLEAIADFGAPPERRRAVLDPVRQALAVSEARTAPVARVFCPIWRDPWMSVGGDTYAHDMLRLCGGVNVFADWGDRRYPRVELADVEAAAPDVILLPDEPYVFGAADRSELSRLRVPAARSSRIHTIDGTWVSWYGPRIARALREIGALLTGSASQSQSRSRADRR